MEDIETILTLMGYKIHEEIFKFQHGDNHLSIYLDDKEYHFGDNGERGVFTLWIGKNLNDYGEEIAFHSNEEFKEYILNHI